MPFYRIPIHIRLSNNRWSSKSCQRPGRSAEPCGEGRARAGCPGWDRSQCPQASLGHVPSSDGHGLAAETLCVYRPLFWEGLGRL